MQKAVSQGLDQVCMLWSSVDYYKMLLHETYVNMFVEYMKIILVIVDHTVKNGFFVGKSIQSAWG